MVTTPCPHCNQKIEFDATMPGTYECPYCGKQFRLGKRTKSNPIGNTTKPQKVVQQSKRSVGENIVLGLSLPIGIICMIMSIIILFNGLSRDRFILFFFILPFSLGLYLLLYSYKIISEPAGSKRATSNQTATLLMGGEEITIQLESKNNKTSVDNALNVVAVGISISLVLTIVGLIVAAIAIYIFVMQFFLFLGSFGGGGW
jgi:predicted RNA-binding Zn-ribbon protein involved in translation (DUF1610 family)